MGTETMANTMANTMVFHAKISHKIRDIKYRLKYVALISTRGLRSDRLIFVFREMDKAVKPKIIYKIL